MEILSNSKKVLCTPDVGIWIYLWPWIGYRDIPGDKGVVHYENSNTFEEDKGQLVVDSHIANELFKLLVEMKWDN